MKILTIIRNSNKQNNYQNKKSKQTTEKIEIQKKKRNTKSETLNTKEICLRR